MPGEGVTGRTVALHLMQPFFNTSRNLTADNWFTSCELAADLKTRKTSFVGTMRRNNRSVPPIANTAGRARKDTKVWYSNDDTALISFWDKGSKPVLLLDSPHRVVPVPEPPKKLSQ